MKIRRCLTSSAGRSAAPTISRLQPGLVIAVEPMVNVGTKKVKLLRDEWTQITKDHKLSAHFEHTIAITDDGPVRLTAAPTPAEVEQLA